MLELCELLEYPIDADAFQKFSDMVQATLDELYDRSISIIDSRELIKNDQIKKQTCKNLIELSKRLLAVENDQDNLDTMKKEFFILLSKILMKNNCIGYSSEEIEKLMDYDAYLYLYSQHLVEDIRNREFLAENPVNYSERLSIGGIINIYERLFGKNDINKSILNKILYAFAEEALIPLIIYTAIFSKDVQKAFSETYTMEYVLKCFKDKTYFFKRSQKDNYELSNCYLQFFCDCLYSALYSDKPDIEVLSKSNLSSKFKVNLDDSKRINDILKLEVHPKFKEAIIEHQH